MSRSGIYSAVTPRLLVVLALALSGRAAWADAKDDARRHFLAGLSAAQSQQYEVALEEFLEAQALYPHPATVYNIARSYADLQDWEMALRYYRIYLDLAPDKEAELAPVISAIEARARPAVVIRATGPQDTPNASSPSASATAAEVERLEAIAGELAALSRSLANRGTAPAEATPVSDPAVPSAPSTDGAALPAAGALMSDAYQRVVVTASRYGQDPLDSPSTIAVITDQDIRLSGATTVPDLLRRVAGVDVMALSAAEPDVSIRGFNRELSNKVLVLIDGRSVYADVLGSVFWSHLPISLQEIERIEVIRGPGSAIYGANAVTGVINIITREPGAGDSLVSAEAGTPDYAQGTALVTGRHDRTSWRVSAGYHQTGRWSAEDDLGSTEALVPFVENQDRALEMLRANGRVDRSFLDQGFLSLSGGYSSGLMDFYTLGALGEYAFDLTTAYARGDVAYGPVHLRAFYNTWTGTNAPWSIPAGGRDMSNELDTDVVDLELETNGEFETGRVTHRVNAGVGYRYKYVDWDYLRYTTDDGEVVQTYTEHHLNAFAQESATIGPVSLLGSLRIDRHPRVALAKTISPRAAAIVRVAESTSVRATGGTSFRAPSFLESYLHLEIPVSADGVYLHALGDEFQDELLVPERIVTGEIGLHDESTRYHVADLALYVNRVTELIGLSSLTPTVSSFDEESGGFLAGYTAFQNLGDTYLGYGAELDARFFPVDGLDVYGNLSVQRVSRDPSAETESLETVSVDGASCPVDRDCSVSLAKANLGVMYRSPWRADASLHAHINSPQVWTLREFGDDGSLILPQEQVASRTILVARLAVRPLADESLELAGTAWNLLGLLGGDAFQEHPKGQYVGSRLYGTATWRF